jgi:galactose mutarotase-like enzyme
MPQHGFARILDFEVMDHGESDARLRLTDSAETRAHYPFPFEFEVHIGLAPGAVRLDFVVSNTGERPLPYALGYHPAFPWPFDAQDKAGHEVVFDRPEDPRAPLITGSGLLDPTLRSVPLDGARLPLSPSLFEKGALVFRNARSRRMRFLSPSGTAIALEAPSCSHLALWTKPTAPFLSMEAWTGHADWMGFTGELAERASIRLLAPGDRAQDAMVLRWSDAEGSSP